MTSRYVESQRESRVSDRSPKPTATTERAIPTFRVKSAAQ